MPEPGLASEEQTAALRTIEEARNSLQPFLGVEKCVGCECLQAALTELMMALEALPTDPKKEELLKAVRRSLDLSNLHGCLGCVPCDPVDVLASFYRVRDTTGTQGQSGCAPSGPDEGCAP